jgi:hypothetical protein
MASLSPATKGPCYRIFREPLTCFKMFMKCIKTVLFGRPNINCFMADLYAKFVCKTRQTIKNSADGYATTLELKRDSPVSRQYQIPRLFFQILMSSTWRSMKLCGGQRCYTPTRRSTCSAMRSTWRPG